MSNRRETLAGLSGGRKQTWLRVHRSEVIEFYAQNGVGATMFEFRLQPDTLERLLEGPEQRTDTMGRLTPSERALALAEQALEADRETRHMVLDLKKQVQEVEPLLEFATGLARAMRQLEVRLLAPPRAEDIKLGDFPQSGQFRRE